MFLDLDRFKLVNDSLGHVAGNELLREVARRLRGLRAARRSGGAARRRRVRRAAGEPGDPADRHARWPSACWRASAQPLCIGGTEVLPAASLGITFSDLGYRTVDEVLRDADLAMYEAKADGRGRVALFDSSMHERVRRRSCSSRPTCATRSAKAQLSLQFQPIVRPANRYRLSGFEALARWHAPASAAPIAPAVFIALAEETGQIEALTAWVIDHAVAQLARWRQQAAAARGAGHARQHLGPRPGSGPAWWPRCSAVLARHGAAAGALTLEITETTLMSRLDVALVTLQALREAGVQLQHRRLRHRLLVAGLPEHAADRQPEDRPQLRDAACARGRRTWRSCGRC